MAAKLFSTPQTLEALARKAEGSLWRGNRSERKSYRTLWKAVRLIGGDTPLSDITTHTIDALDQKLSNRAPATRNRYHSFLSSLLKWGRDRGFFPYPLPVFDREPEENGRIRWISPAEERALCSLLEGYGKPSIAALVRVAIATGMRRSELLGLSERDIEDKWVRLWKTKTKTPRSVPISSDTRDLLRTLVRTGMPTEQDLRYYWHRARKHMGLLDDPGFVFHACRHTCATRMVERGVDLRVIQRFLGHKTIITTTRYAHVSDETLASALPHTDTSPVAQMQRPADLPLPTPAQGYMGSYRIGIDSDLLHKKGLSGRGGTVDAADLKSSTLGQFSMGWTLKNDK